MAEPSKFGRAALAYAEHGWFVFPLGPRSKEPWTGHAAFQAPKSQGGFKRATRNLAHLREAWTIEPRCNIGLWPGPSGLVVLDRDHAEGDETARSLGCFDVPTLTTWTGRGGGAWHRYYRSPSFTVQDTTQFPGLLVRSQGGCIVLPPSIHPDTGATYRWDRWGEAVATLPEMVARTLHAASSTAAAPPRPRSHVGWTSLPARLERRIGSYLDALPVGLRDGQGRNPAAYIFAGFLARDLQLADPLALEWLGRWNAAQSDPLTQNEITGILANVHAYGRHAYGAGLDRRAS